MVSKFTAEELEGMIWGLAASFTFADHLGDVAESIAYVLKKLGLREDWYDQNELYSILAKRGVKTLWGDDLTIEDEGK